MTIRDETPADAAAIAALVTEAFLSAAHSDANEAAIVAGLRRAGALTVSLVAAGSTGLAGHVAASPVTLDGAAGWHGIGPLAVRLSARRRGTGAALMRACLARLRAAGSAGAVLVGDAAYYARFGFARRDGLTVAGIPPEYVLGLPFSEAPARGAVRYHPAFGLE